MNFRKLISVFVAVLLGLTVTAQEAIIGVRQGLGFWLRKEGIGKGSLRYGQDDHFSWNKEVFFRKHLKNKWAGELSLATYQLKYRSQYANDQYRSSSAHLTRFFEANIVVQYDVTYPLFSYMFPVLTGMKSFLGFSAIPRVAIDGENQTLEHKDGAITTGQRETRGFSFFLGMNYTHIIPLTKKFFLTSELSFSMQPFDAYRRTATERPNRQISLMTGIGYKL